MEGLAKSSLTNHEERRSSSASDSAGVVCPSRSASPLLRNGNSGTNSSGSSSSLISQLEQLANTSLLTVRLSFKEIKAKYDESRPFIISELEEIMHHFKGYIIGDDHIEPYEYLPDDERSQLIHDNKDMFIFANGSIDFANSNDESRTSKDWKYDSVIQVQFKRSNVLLRVANEVEKCLQNGSTPVERWSISTCHHALTQPGNLYVRGIPKNITIEQILPTFSKFGPVSSLKIICDDITGESLGYGFLSYPLGSQASRCIYELNGKTFENSTLFVNYHIERKERERIYRDNIKENNHDDKFKSIFIGNIPVQDESKETIKPDEILELLNSKLSPEFEDFKIVSYYFPKKIESESAEFRESESESDLENVMVGREKSANSSNESLTNEENRYRNYGFIKFANHEQALRTIEVLNNYKWYGSSLIVNRAVQNKGANSHSRSYNDKTSTTGTPIFGGRNLFYSYGSSTSGNPFGYYNGSGNVFFPYVNSPSIHKANSAGDTESLYGINQSINTTAFINPYHMYRGLAPTSSSQSPFDVPNSASSIYPVNPYRLMSPNTPLALPLPAKDQQESNLYVKHLPLEWKDEDFYKLYEQYGEIISAKIITVGGSKNKDNNEEAHPTSADHDTKHMAVGSSRGYGFVCFKNPFDASRAILATDGFQLTATHTLNVSFAQKRAKSSAGQSNQGIQSSRNSASQAGDGATGIHSSGKSAARRFSHADQTYKPKFMGSTRHHGGNTGRNFSSSFLQGNGNWTTVPVIPNVSPGMTGMSFLPPDPSSMMGSYVMPPVQMMNQNQDDR